MGNNHPTMTPLIQMNPLFALTAPLPVFAEIPNSIFPYLIPLAGMAFGLVAIIVGTVDKLQKRRLRHELLRVALEKGQPLPPELLDEKTAERAQRDDRRSGIIAVAVGLALYVFLGLLIPQYGVKWVALIPGFIGLALLLNWALERAGDDRQNKR